MSAATLYVFAYLLMNLTQQTMWYCLQQALPRQAPAAFLLSAGSRPERDSLLSDLCPAVGQYCPSPGNLNTYFVFSCFFCIGGISCVSFGRTGYLSYHSAYGAFTTLLWRQWPPCTSKRRFLSPGIDSVLHPVSSGAGSLLSNHSLCISSSR